jgi:N-sulfoglucosamine sulfohydrolase
MSKMNILYINSHDTGRYIQPYGYKVPTPNLQKLAEQGVLFRQCYCANPTCSPSRASLLTGQYAHSNGMLGLSHRGFSLNDYSQHIIHTLKEYGYFCALSGVQHIDGPTEDVSQYASQIGYDAVLDKADMRGRWDRIAQQHPRAQRLKSHAQDHVRSRIDDVLTL